MNTVFSRFIVIAFSALFLASCGGGGGGSSSETVTVPSGVGNGDVVDTHDPFSGGFTSLQSLPNNNAAAFSCAAINTQTAGSTISGRVLYERVPMSAVGLNYDAQVAAPARGVVVEAVAASNSSCSSTVVDATISDGDGNYGLVVPDNQAVCVQVRAQLYRQSVGSGASWDIQVSDNTKANAPYYLLDNTAATPAADPVRNLLALSGWSAPSSQYAQARSAAPFAILDSICEALDTVVDADPNIQLPLLNLRWSQNNNVADDAVSEGDVGGAFYILTRRIDSTGAILDASNEIFLLGDDGVDTDEYDAHVITHEFTHYLMANAVRSDSLGGSHSLSDKLDMTVAFDEGTGDALSGVFLDRSPVAQVPAPAIYQDSFGAGQSNSFKFSLATGGSGTRGWFNESSVFRIVYNLFDPANLSGTDQLSFSFATLYHSLVQLKNEESFLSIYSFIDQLKQDNPASSGLIDTLVGGENITVVDSFGSGQSLPSSLNASHDEDVLPVYVNLIEGVTRRICSNTQFGAFNKLSVVRYLSFTASRFDDYSIQMRSVGEGKPAIEIHKAGQFIDGRFLENPGTLGFNVALSPGLHVLAAYDVDNFEEEGEANTRRCFDVTIF